MMIKALLPFLAVGLLNTPHGELPDLQIGDAMPVPEHRMMDVSGEELSLAQVKGENGLVVIFSCNTCPFVIGSNDSEGWEGRYPGLAAQFAKNGVGFALVNSNEAKRDKGDSYEDMRMRYKEKNYGQYYMLDTDHVVADAFGARTTPHVFLFNKDMKLVYKGAIDDSVESASGVKENYLSNALKGLVSGNTIDPAMTRNIGCSIKRKPHEH